MSTALEEFRQGNLGNAVARAIEAVKAKPGDLNARWLLCEMLSFAGEFTRADTHLETILQQDMNLALSVSLFRQLLRAETARQDWFEQGRTFEVAFEPDAAMRQRMAGAVQLRAADPAASAAIAQANDADPTLQGQINGRAISGFRDLDDLTAGVLEVLTPNGKYYWVPLAKLATLEFRPPAAPRDQLWRQATMTLHEGPGGEVYIPALYPKTRSATDDRLRLGRMTDWIEGPEKIVRGVGQRMFLAGDEEIGVMEIQTLELAPVT